jgi:ubiquinone/menaquinone biosynthesis C-methylase UbiE
VYVYGVEPMINDFYDANYSRILSTGLLGKLQIRVHNIIDKPLLRNYYEKILEVGAGDLEHFKRFQLSFSDYWATDIRMTKKPKEKVEKLNSLLTLAYADAQNLSFNDNSFDLLLATCLLIHLPNPEKALNEWRRVTKDGGEIAIYVPCDPGLLIRFSRTLFVLPKHSRNKSRNYRTLCAKEHVSSLHVLNILIKDTFKFDKVKIKRWPFRFFGWNLNLAYIYHVEVRKG